MFESIVVDFFSCCLFVQSMHCLNNRNSYWKRVRLLFSLFEITVAAICPCEFNVHTEYRHQAKTQMRNVFSYTQIHSNCYSHTQIIDEATRTNWNVLECMIECSFRICVIAWTDTTSDLLNTNPNGKWEMRNLLLSLCI